jgi:hypothetical protein
MSSLLRNNATIFRLCRLWATVQGRMAVLPVGDACNRIALHISANRNLASAPALWMNGQASRGSRKTAKGFVIMEEWILAPETKIPVTASYEVLAAGGGEDHMRMPDSIGMVGDWRTSDRGNIE